MIEVRFKGNRKAYYVWEGEAGQGLAIDDGVIVEAERGLDFGRVSALGDSAASRCGRCSGCAAGEPPPTPTQRAVRRATKDEVHLANELRKAEEDVRRRVVERVAHHAMPMKATDAEWQRDRNKLTVYFTAEKRVDFRALVLDLAALFRTRIDLRQISAREEAKRLDGVGRCGRQYCCSSWLPELRPVSLGLAKDQHLSLNPAQISGGCGRLLCCLRYEHEFYVASRKRFPKEGKVVKTDRGAETVLAVDIFRERVTLRAEGGTGDARVIPLVQLREEIERSGA